MTDPPENLKTIKPSTLEVSTITPPSRTRKGPAPYPPPMTRKRRFKPNLSSDSISPVDMSGVTEMTTPEKEDDEDGTPQRRPVRQRLLSPASSSLKATGSKRAASSPENQATSPKQTRCSPRTNIVRYTNLFYIEVLGVLRQNHNTKHRGVQPTSLDSPTASDQHWDRNVLLRISYRLCLDDNTPQFSLIVYDHQTRNPRTRRNLMAEFQASEVDEVEKTPVGVQHRSQSKSTVKSTPTPGKTSSLRRLRF